MVDQEIQPIYQAWESLELKIVVLVSDLYDGMPISGTVYKSEAKKIREIDIGIPVCHKNFVKSRNKSISRIFLPLIFVNSDRFWNSPFVYVFIYLFTSFFTFFKAYP